MIDDLGFLSTDVSEKVQAIVRLLERSDPDDAKRRHTLRYPGQPRKARRFIRRAQRIYIESRRAEGA